MVVVNSSLKLEFNETKDSKHYQCNFNNSGEILQKIHEVFERPLIKIVVSIVYTLMLLVFLFGFVGNGTVIWLLGFRMKRTSFTTYILNLAIADTGVLLVSILIYIYTAYMIIIILLSHEAVSLSGLNILACIWPLLCTTDQLLLTAISIDRCVAVLFPVWHRCHRRPGLSKAVCISVWVLSFLLSGLDRLLIFANQFALLLSIVNVAICTPLMAVSTVILLVNICVKSQQRKRGKLLVTILLALFFFLIFGLPVNYWYILTHYYILDGIDVNLLVSASSDDPAVICILSAGMDLILIPVVVAFACMVLNCSVNPLIYFLMGKDKKSRSKFSMKVALQRVFKEEENSRGQGEPEVEAQLS